MKKFLLILLICQSAVAVKEYYSLSRSYRALGMGGAFYGLSDDEYALFYNPAGLSLYSGQGQFMWGFDGAVSHRGVTNIYRFKSAADKSSNIDTVLNDIADLQGDPVYVNVNTMPFYLRKHFGVALLIADTKANVALLGKEFDSSVDLTALSDSGLIFGYGRSLFHPKLHLGINAKFLVRAGGRKEFSLVDLAQSNAVSTNLETLGGVGTGVDFDLGALYVLPPIPGIPSIVRSQVGLTLSNILATDFPGNRRGTPPSLPRMVSLGSAFYFMGTGFFDNFIAVFDLAEFPLGGQSDAHFGARGGSLWKHVNLGLEAPIHGWLRPRIGIHQGYIGGGLTLDFRYAKIDFAYSTEELASGVNRLPSRRYQFRLALGIGTPPPAPVVGPPDPQEPPAQVQKAISKDREFPARSKYAPKETKEAEANEKATEKTETENPDAPKKDTTTP